MKCPTPSGYPMCETCKAAGLNVCAFDGPALPLVEAEKPTVTHRRPKIIWLPPGVSTEEAERLMDSFYGKRR